MMMSSTTTTITTKNGVAAGENAKQQCCVTVSTQIHESLVEDTTMTESVPIQQQHSSRMCKIPVLVLVVDRRGSSCFLFPTKEWQQLRYFLVFGPVRYLVGLFIRTAMSSDQIQNITIDRSSNDTPTRFNLIGSVCVQDQRVLRDTLL